MAEGTTDEPTDDGVYSGIDRAGEKDRAPAAAAFADAHDTGAPEKCPGKLPPHWCTTEAVVPHRQQIPRRAEVQNETLHQFVAARILLATWESP